MRGVVTLVWVVLVLTATLVAVALLRSGGLWDLIGGLVLAVLAVVILLRLPDRVRK